MPIHCTTAMIVRPFLGILAARSVRSFALPRPSRLSSTMSASSTAVGTEDPYIWLEDVESSASLDFARASNEACLAKLGNPEASPTYQRVLDVLESEDRIPHVSAYGQDDSGAWILYNFWKDAKNPKGLWRKTTLEEYQKPSPTWKTVIDVDELASDDGISWVWKGAKALPRSRDPLSEGACTRALISLSRGGSDAVVIREFDMAAGEFVSDEPFAVPEAKTRASYKSRHVLTIGSDFGPDSLTDSGYPRTVREWKRGTPLESAPTVFAGEKTDVSVYSYVADERIWNGGLYEVRGRSLTFYTSKTWMRKILPEHLLAEDDPARAQVEAPPDFVEVNVQDDASIDFLGQLLIISLRSDWQPIPEGRVYPKGSVLLTPTDHFLAHGCKESSYEVLFEPTARTAYEYYTVTKNYLILATMDNVKSKLDWYQIAEDGASVIKLNVPSPAQIRDCSVRPIDPHVGSDAFWFTTSDFVTPSTLYLADAAKMIEAGDNPDAFIEKKLKSLPPQYDSDNLSVAQQIAISKDGTEIPYFIIMSKDTQLNGKNPTLLYGYGGFEVSLGPHYIATSGLAWLERGGVYIEANIRGGGEFGPAWHQAALKANRNKCYEDFIAVAEHLIATGVCTSQSLAIRGGSNGGLLMGNMYCMRPDLFGAIHCAVPLLDMKRYHTLLAGASWMAEYGNPDTEDWEFLQKYSPYHNIQAGVQYPPILVTTSTRDDRVHPGHARKFVKKLTDMGIEDVYYYENIEGGHGGAADAKQSAFMTTLAYDFMFATLTKNIESSES